MLKKTVIRVENLQKRYGRIVAVDSVSFELFAGESFGLLGPNGAGKTTTINMIVGVLKPDQGKISFDGAKEPTESATRQKIGIAPQSLAIYDDLTAEENLSFFAKLYGLKRATLEKQLNWTLELSGLKERKKDRVKTFSGGMKRRLNLACGLVHDPPVIFLDEPTLGVDPQSRNLIFEKIELLKAQGRTIVYTTHYMEEAQRLCDRVSVIDQGKILALDTVENLIKQHGGKAVVEADLVSAPDPALKVPGHLDGLHLRFESSQPLEEVARLSEEGLKFQTLHVDRPDLESVFLNLTGRSLRD